MLQLVLYPRASLDQLVAVDEQLPLVAHLCIRHPDTRKSAFDQQRQDMSRIALVGLLLAHVAGADLRGFTDPYLMPQPLHQRHKPLAVAHRLHPNRRSPNDGS